MNLDELRRVKNRERETDSLQELPDSFYADVAAYIRERKAERSDLAESVDDPFSSEEISRLSDEIETAEQVAESIYERRVGKVVKQASFAAADMGAGDAGDLTAEERDLYEDLVDRITENKTRVLDVIASERDPADTATRDAGAATSGDAGPDRAGAPDATDTAGPAVESEPGPANGDERRSDPDGPRAVTDGTGVDAADLMGGDASGTETAAGQTAGADPGDDAADADRATDRTTVRVTRDVGEIFGVDERVYTLEADDVVTLPEENAAPLVDRDAAEPLE